MSSSYAVGLAYELLVVRTLSRYSFSLQHCGKGGDRGKDFMGQWILPDQRVQVVGQCKYRQARANLAALRELDSVIARLQCLPDGKPPVGMLVTNKGFSLGMMKFSSSSKYPIILCHIVPVTHSLRHTLDHTMRPLDPPTASLASQMDSHVWEAGCNSHEVALGLPHEDLVKGDEENNTGLVVLFEMNPVAEQLLPHVRVASRQSASMREPLLYHVNSRNNSSCVLNLGAITKRSVTGIPQAWEEMKLTVGNSFVKTS